MFFPDWSDRNSNDSSSCEAQDESYWSVNNLFNVVQAAFFKIKSNYDFPSTFISDGVSSLLRSAKFTSFLTKTNYEGIFSGTK